MLYLMFATFASPAMAQATQEAKEREARKACLSGDYASGSKILSDLFVDSGNPTYIYNLGRCFEQNGRWEEAISRFLEYLRTAKKLSPDEKLDVEKHIEDCQSRVAPKESNGTDRHSTEGQGKEPGERAKVEVHPYPALQVKDPAFSSKVISSDPAGRTGATAPASNSGRGLRMAGLTCGGVGLISVGVGIYFYSRAQSLTDKISKQTTANPSDLQAGKDAETMQWVFYSVGAAALVTGTVLYMVGWASSDDGTPVARVIPTIGPGLTAISVRGTF